jgi:hypothetical protein
LVVLESSALDLATQKLFQRPIFERRSYYSAFLWAIDDRMARKRVITTTRELRLLLDPWPIALTKGRWRWRLASMAKCRRLKCFWKIKGKRVSAETAARSLLRYWPEKHHGVVTIQQAGQRARWIIVENGVVVDGNHHLLAMIRAGYKGPVIVIEYVKRSGRGDENVQTLRKRWELSRKARWQGGGL